MKKMSNILVVLVMSVLLGTTEAESAHPFTYYGYLTDVEVTEFNEIIWFWTPDTMWGPVHSNEFIGLKYSPTFYDSVTTSKGEFRFYQPGNIHFEYEPDFNAPPINFPRSFGHLRTCARVRIEDNNGRMMTVMRFRGEEGIFVYQYRLGLPPEDSLIMRIPNMMGQIVHVNGKLDMEGIVSGRITVNAQRDIGLLDDLRYLGSDPHTGLFDEDTVTSMLAVVSESDIIIRNTIANGRDDGRHAEPDNWNRHSIVLNGSYLALGTSFIFEHQNDDWDRYQGPNPDERGQINLVGGVTQQRRGHVHRSNHTGTGYGMSWRYDHRLKSQYPTGLAPEEMPYIHGYFDRLVYEGRNYRVINKEARTVIVEAGATLNLEGSSALLVHDSLIVKGTAESPVRITATTGFGAIFTYAQDSLFISIEHAIIDQDVTLNFENSNTTIRNSLFEVTPYMSGTIRIDSCEFENRFEHHWTGDVTVSRSTFHNHGVVISGRNSRLDLDHVTIVGGNGYGVEALAGAEAMITNSIVAFLRHGVHADNRSDVRVRYCDVSDNVMGNFLDCQPGVGTFSSDPLLLDVRRGEFVLTEGSPCIDAGDPASPRDPDGTRADIGAFWLDRGLDADGDANADGDGDVKMKGGVLTASPNPFNATTVIRFKDGYGDPSSLRIYDLAGREVHSSATPLRVAERKTADHRGSAEEGRGGYGDPSTLRIYDLAGREVHSSATPLRVAERKTADHRGSAEEDTGGSAEEGGGGYGDPSTLRIYDLAGREVHSSATPLRVAERKTADHRGSAEEGGGGYGDPSTLRIYDLAGREVHSSATPLRVAERKTADHRGSAEEGGGGYGAPPYRSFVWDASEFPAGIYIVRVGNGMEAKSIKVVKVD